MTRSHYVRRACSVSALAVLIVLVAVIPDAFGEPVGDGDQAPGFTLQDIEGKTYKLSDYRGKAVVVLDFGRFTCEPCRKTAKDLQRLRDDLAGVETLRVFQVNLDGPLTDRVVPQGIRELGITFPVLLDRKYEVADAYRVEVIPFIVVIDPKGVIRHTHVGYEEELRQTITELHAKYRPK